MSDAPAVRVVHIDLARGLDIDPGGTEPLYAVLWWRGRPVAHLDIPAGPRPPRPVLLERAADRVAEALGPALMPDAFPTQPPRLRRGRRRRPLRRPSFASERAVAAAPVLSAAGDAPDPAGVAGMSVVVCTRDRGEKLERCLSALLALDPAPPEIVLVDNSSEGDGVRDVVAGRPRVTYVRERRPGLSVARNAGIRAAGGELIAFTDDDTVADGRWAGRLAEPFADPRVMAVTGLVLPLELRTPSQLAFQRELGGLHHGYLPVTFDAAFFDEWRWKGAAAWFVGAGANMAFRREAFARVGLFDERLGAGASGCSEDSEMWYRLLAAGWHCRYHPSAVVSHQHREDDAALTSQAEAYMRGHMSALFVQYSRHRHPGDLRRALVTLPVSHAKRALRVALGRGHETDVPYLRGYLAGLRYAPLAVRRHPAPPLPGATGP